MPRILSFNFLKKKLFMLKKLNHSKTQTYLSCDLKLFNFNEKFSQVFRISLLFLLYYYIFRTYFTNIRFRKRK